MSDVKQAFLNDELKGQLTEVFATLKNNVTLAVFTKKEDCPYGDETKQLMDEISKLSDKILVREYDLETDVEQVNAWDIKLVPSIVMLDGHEKYRGVKFNGIPLGHEINSFIGTLLEIGGAGEEIPEDFKDRMAKINKPVNIKVFVTLGCPHCAPAVQKAHKFALENDFIVGEMIDASTFPELSDKFNVSSVPKIVINDDLELIGNQHMETILDEIEKALA